MNLQLKKQDGNNYTISFEEKLYMLSESEDMSKYYQNLNYSSTY